MAADRQGHAAQLGDADEGEAGLQQRQQRGRRQRRHPRQQRVPRLFQHRLVRLRPAPQIVHSGICVLGF